jgi:diguanylate cyclase
MAADGDEHERTIAFAEIALGQMKALRLSAEPHNYEVWYHYATGYHPSLNKTINDTIAQKGKLAPADIQDIYATYFSPTRLTDRLDTVGTKVVDEIEQVMAMIDATLGSATSYSESLADVTQRLGGASDREGLRVIVESLVKATREVERDNHALTSRLKASKKEITELQQDLEAVRSESLTDPLTSLANRKYFDQTLAAAMADAERSNRPMSLMMVDIDHFKSFNDTFGHLTGDQVLRLVALCLKQNVKGQDLAARYGGEEFAVILPNTPVRQALMVADHVRRAVVAKELMKRSTGESLGRVTISVGVAGRRAGDTMQTLIERADASLYAAKRAGRNKVIGEADPEAAIPAKTKVA